MLLLQGQAAALGLERLAALNALSDAEFAVYSQRGEDGILEWLLQRVPVGSRRFIEFGVESYCEANTRFLLLNRNWKGLVIDGSPTNVEAIRKDPMFYSYGLTAICRFITRENINSLFRDAGFEGEIGVLSIDIDGNDYWVWEAIDCVNPAIVVCEYNAVFGDAYPVTIPYNKDFQRTAAHFSNLYYGASIGALIGLARKKGYVFLGTTSHANDAFFIRQDLAHHVVDRIERKVAAPSLVRESRGPDGNLTFLSGAARLQCIAGLPVLRLDNDEIVKLGDLASPYSEAWLSEM
jgi:hypothetical protein